MDVLFYYHFIYDPFRRIFGASGRIWFLFTERRSMDFGVRFRKRCIPYTLYHLYQSPAIGYRERERDLSSFSNILLRPDLPVPFGVIYRQ